MKFPIDPNAPSLPLRKRLSFWTIIEKIVLIISVIMGMLGIKIAMDSFNLSKKAMESSIKQYEEASISSAKQFDTMTNILGIYQRINENILLQSKFQLSASKLILDRITELDKPELEILNTDFIIQSSSSNTFGYKSFVNFNLRNKGSRPLKLVSARLFITTDEYAVFNQLLNKINEIINNNPVPISFRLKNDFKSYSDYANSLSLLKQTVYLCLSAKFVDLLNNKKTTRKFYLGLKRKENYIQDEEFPESSDPISMSQYMQFEENLSPDQILRVNAVIAQSNLENGNKEFEFE